MEILSEGHFIRVSGPGAIDRILLNHLAAFQSNIALRLSGALIMGS